MPQRPTGNEQHPDYESPQPLPEKLAQALTPGVRRALNHPTRRGILRELHRSGATPRTANDLSRALPGVSRKTLIYHAHVLAEYGGVMVTATPSKQGAAWQLFSSGVASDRQYIAVLTATEHLDLSA